MGDLSWAEKRRRIHEAGENAIVGLRRLREAIEQGIAAGDLPPDVSQHGQEQRDA